MADDERLDTPLATPEGTQRALEWIVGIAVVLISIASALALLERA